MINSSTCPRCDQIETLKHKFIECPYARRIWAETFPYIEKLSEAMDLSQDKTKLIIAANRKSNIATMTLSAEIMQSILYLKAEQTFLVHPKHVVKQAIKRLSKNEENPDLKRNFIELVRS